MCTIFEECIKCAIREVTQPLKDALSLIFCEYHNNIESLKKECEDMRNKKKEIQSEEDKGKSEGKKLTKEAQDWIKDVKELVTGAEMRKLGGLFKDDEIKIKEFIVECSEVAQESTNNEQAPKDQGSEVTERNQCCGTFFACYLCHRYKKSKLAKQQAAKIQELMGKVPNWSGMTELIKSADLENQPSGFVKGLESRDAKKRDVLERLKAADVDVVAIYGMGGIGKTTLAKEVAKIAKDEGVFDKTATAEISESPNIKDIQKQIAEGLGIDLKDESIAQRGKMLYHSILNQGKGGEKQSSGKPQQTGANDLEKQSSRKPQQTGANDLEKLSSSKQQMPQQKGAEGKQINAKKLIILDNIWSKLDLDKIGIPSDSSCCKILITSRDKKVCDNMHVKDENLFDVGQLNGDEALKLFRYQLPKELNYSEEHEKVGHRLLEMCKGLPLAIRVLADAIGNQGLASWRKVADELEIPMSAHVGGLLSETYSLIMETSYKLIGSEEKKMYFFLACLFQHGSKIPIRDMMRYSIGLGLIQHVNSLIGVEELANRWTKELILSSLLLPDESPEHVKIHDVVRDSALKFAAKGGQKMLVDIPGWLLKDTCEKYSVISMTYGRHRFMFNKMKFDKLETLVLNRERDDDDVNSLSTSTQPSRLDDDFFKGMKCLKVLVLKDMVFENGLPKSITSLKNLRTLHLESCTLGDIKLIGELQELRVLSLRESKVEELPEEMKKLSDLRLLDMTGCGYQKKIPDNVMGSLSRLEGLYLRKNWSCESSPSFGHELKSLTYLTVLEILVKTIEDLPTNDRFLDSLNKFAVYIGTNREMEEELEESVSCALFLSSVPRDSIKRSLNVLIRKTERLMLENISELENVVPGVSSSSTNFRELRILQVSGCGEMKNLINDKAELMGLAFPNLVRLELTELQGLRSIMDFDSQTPSAGMFTKLERLLLDELPQLHDYVLPLQLAQKLVEVSVSNCGNLKFILKQLEGDDCVKQLPRLKILKLKHLDQLQSVLGAAGDLDSTTSSTTVAFPVLEILKVKWCHPDGKLWEQLAAIQPHFSGVRNLKQLTIEGCKGLESLGSPSLATALSQLESLKIVECDGIEEIISKGREGTDDVSVSEITFPKLNSLNLQSLEQLKWFYGGSYKLKFPALRDLYLDSLPELTIFAKVENSTSLSPTQAHLFDSLVIWRCHQFQFSIHGDDDKARTASEPSNYNNYLSNLCLLQFVRRLELNALRGWKYVFRADVVESGALQHLQELEVYDCDEMEAVVEIREQVNYDGNKAIDMFPALKLITLWDCSSIRWFCGSPSVRKEGPRVFTYSFPALDSLEIKVCEQFQFSIKLDDQPQSHEPSNLDLLRFVRRLELRELGWKYAFRADVFESGVLQHLQELEVYYCDKMEGVVEIREEENHCDNKVIDMFPALKFITLGYCSSIRWFCGSARHQHHILNFHLPSLERVKIKGCQEMESFTCTSGQLLTPQLCQVKIKRSPNLKSFSSGRLTAPLLTQVQVDWNGEKFEMKEGENINYFLHTLFRKSQIISFKDLEPVPSGYMPGLESREMLKKRIMELLKKDDVDAIGICGMGGVGKTTLAKEVGNEARNMFDIVAMVEVLDNPDIERIQDHFATKFDLTLDSMHSTEARATKLCNAIFPKKDKEENGRKVLIILDNLWKELDLLEVGIPRERAQQFCCKILLTTREKNVCTKMSIHDDNIIDMDLLSEDESRRLFRKQVGNVEEDESKQILENRLLKTCGRLPLAIATLANTIRRQDLSVWKYFADQLEKPISSENEDVQQRSTDVILETSYKFIPSNERKMFFLLTCLFPLGSVIPIEELMRYGIGLELFQNAKPLVEIMEQASRWAKQLISPCLLLQDVDNVYGCFKEQVKVHDVVQASAMSFMKEDGHMFLVEAIPIMLSKEALKKYTAVSLGQGQDHSQLGGMETEKLQTLLLKGSQPSEFDSSFFQGMIRIKVLVLSNMNFEESLPNSITRLRNLRTLHLESCELGDIELICELTELVVLSLRESKVRKIPQGMKKLRDLLLLDLTHCIYLEKIPSDVLGSLTQLEGLYMSHSYTSWRDNSEAESGDQEEACIAELGCMHNLSVLELGVKNIRQLPITDDKFVNSLNWFTIYVGQIFEKKYLLEAVKFFRSLMLTEIPSELVCRYKCLMVLLPTTHFLQLRYMKGLRNVVPTLDSKGFRELKCLRVEGCSEMDYLISSDNSEQVEKDTNGVMHFPHLKVLLLNGCSALTSVLWDAQGSAEAFFSPKTTFPSLEELWVEFCPSIAGKLWDWGPVMISNQLHPYGVLDKLKHITIYRCDELKSVCSSSSAATLVHLQSLVIEKCEGMEEVICKGREENEVGNCIICFSKLKSLQLTQLVQLKQLYGGSYEIQFPALTTLELYLLPGLKTFVGAENNSRSFFPRKMSFPRLEKLKIVSVGGKHEKEREEEEKELCEDTNTMPQLRELKICGFKNWKHVMPLNAALHLEQINISWCNETEAIIKVDGGDKGSSSLIDFPRLKTIYLFDLPKARSLIMISARQEGPPVFTFPALDSLVIWGCHQFHFSNIKHDQELSNMELLRCVRCLELRELDWKYVFSADVVESGALQRLMLLQELTIYNCNKMEAVLEIREDDDDDNNAVQVHLINMFPGLKCITLWSCSEMRWFCGPSCQHNSVVNFHLESLEQVVIYECTKMETFTSDPLTSPLLTQVQVDNIEQEFWMKEGDHINNFLQTLFHKDDPTSMGTQE